jgi:hypothetical protein
MAFVFCALIMYILWWDKPFDVKHKTVVTFPTLENSSFRPKMLLNIAEFRTYRQTDLSLQTLFINMFWGMVSTTAFTDNEWIASLTFYAAGTVFSAIHIVAWNWEFPSWICLNLLYGESSRLYLLAFLFSLWPIPSLVSRFTVLSENLLPI